MLIRNISDAIALNQSLCNCIRRCLKLYYIVMCRLNELHKLNHSRTQGSQRNVITDVISIEGRRQSMPVTFLERKILSFVPLSNQASRQSARMTPVKQIKGCDYLLLICLQPLALVLVVSFAESLSAVTSRYHQRLNSQTAFNLIEIEKLLFYFKLLSGKTYTYNMQ